MLDARRARRVARAQPQDAAQPARLPPDPRGLARHVPALTQQGILCATPRLLLSFGYDMI